MALRGPSEVELRFYDSISIPPTTGRCVEARDAGFYVRMYWRNRHASVKGIWSHHQSPSHSTLWKLRRFPAPARNRNHSIVVRQV